jgi:cytidine deaminase
MIGRAVIHEPQVDATNSPCLVCKRTQKLKELFTKNAVAIVIDYEYA